MIILQEPMPRGALTDMDGNFFPDMVKGVVDVAKGLLALDGELHSDLEAMLLEQGSRQEDLWGINLYPELEDEDFLEFDSLINIRPGQGNRSRGVEDPSIQEQIRKVVAKWILP